MVFVVLKPMAEVNLNAALSLNIYFLIKLTFKCWQTCSYILYKGFCIIWLAVGYFYVGSKLIRHLGLIIIALNIILCCTTCSVALHGSKVMLLWWWLFKEFQGIDLSTHNPSTSFCNPLYFWYVYLTGYTFKWSLKTTIQLTNVKMWTVIMFNIVLRSRRSLVNGIVNLSLEELQSF